RRRFVRAIEDRKLPDAPSLRRAPAWQRCRRNVPVAKDRLFEQAQRFRLLQGSCERAPRHAAVGPEATACPRAADLPRPPQSQRIPPEDARVVNDFFQRVGAAKLICKRTLQFIVATNLLSNDISHDENWFLPEYTSQFTNGIRWLRIKGAQDLT